MSLSLPAAVTYASDVWLDEHTVSMIQIPARSEEEAYTLIDHRVRIRDVICFSLFKKVFFRVAMPPFFYKQAQIITTVENTAAGFVPLDEKIIMLCNRIFSVLENIYIPGKKKYILYLSKDLCQELKTALTSSEIKDLPKYTISRTTMKMLKQKVLYHSDISGARFLQALTKGTPEEIYWRSLAVKWESL